MWLHFRYKENSFHPYSIGVKYFLTQRILSICTIRLYAKYFLLLTPIVLKTSCMWLHFRYRENLFTTSSNFLTQRVLSTCTKCFLLFRSNDFTNFLYVVTF